MGLEYTRPEDAVPLPAGGEEKKKRSEPRIQVSNLKLIIILFISFLVVVSDVFTNSIISGFGEKAVHGRTPTAWGVILQGVFLVLFYILAIYLTEHQIL